MAARFNGSSQKYTRTTSLPSYENVTMCGWCRVNGTPGTYSAVIALGNNGATNGVFVGNHNGTWGVAREPGGANAALGSAPSTGTVMFVAFTVNNGIVTGYRRDVGANTLTSNTASGSNDDLIVAGIAIGSSVYDGTDYFNGDVWNVKLWDRVLSADELLVESFYRAVKYPTSLNSWYPLDSASLAGDYSGNALALTATGTPTSADSTSGLWKPRVRLIIPPATAVSHDTSGTLSPDAATVAGAATHLTLHTTTGALSAQAATIAGTADSPHLTSGALTADAAEVAGSAAHLTLHTSSGDLSAQAAAVVGAASHQHAATGALDSQAATVEGAATHLTLHTSTGELAAQAAVITGDAEHAADGVHDAAGELAADAATLAGDAAHLTLHATSGALAADAATVAGTALHPHATTGALESQAATLSGAAERLAAGQHDAAGVLAAGDAIIVGVAQRTAVDDTYPLAGLGESFPLSGLGETFPLAGLDETYPLAGQSE